MSAPEGLVPAVWGLGWALGWALIHGLWQAAVVAGLVRVALVFTRSARSRFAWAWAGLVAIALLFVGTWRVERARAQAALAALDRAAGAGTGELADASTLASMASSGSVESSVWAASMGVLEGALPWIVLGWLCGAAVSVTRAGLGFAGVARLRARALAVDAEIEGVCRRLAASVGVRGTVDIAESEAIEVPAVVGWIRPLILLPRGLIGAVDLPVLEAAIAHELAHLRRGDYALNATSLVIEALFFHHPCVWWLAAVARREREHACDDLVVERVQSPRRYARALLTLEQLRIPTLPDLGPAPSPSLGMSLRAGPERAPLLARVRRLCAATASNTNTEPTMNAPRPQSSSSKSLPSWIPGLALIAALAATLAAPACADALSDESEALIEGALEQGAQARLSVAWMPETVARHRGAIEVAAERHGVDPDLLAIVILVESRGDPAAESPTGARGLMQIMPATAEGIAAERALNEHDVEQLWDPAYNLDLGAYFLARQLDRWGEVELAAAAYNGGPAAVERWLAGEGELSAETEHYRARVTELWAARDSERAPD